ncbi:hypothetical protein PR048_033665 [Dryococelus australis]|uniref:Uncharacterized protein n=1 Tax=Dryococelus australis TaxID=614101 RepID=A0ABQ9G3S1_9NEOP|nr:hypothetical protein PR048_033665 [Dryococelus australis]
MSVRLHQRLRDTGVASSPAHTDAVRRDVPTPTFNEGVLPRLANEPSTSTRASASTTGTSQSTMPHIKEDYSLRAYHL